MSDLLNIKRGEFALDIKKFVEKAGANANVVVKKVLIDMTTRVVMRSPVGDPAIWKNPAPAGYTGGHFRANWQYSFGTPPQGVLNVKDKTGRATIEHIAAVVGDIPNMLGKVHFLMNNLPYAERLETGWSRQAPAGMVGITVREYRTIVNNATKTVKK